ncbi:unnamed protein product [Echinostoma caproni]|uniref:Peptidase_M13 domain-containing protein n=1 Tax=Echinostoma caproni TaxID=27848 RepID=A0A3P8KFN7_9TREM|nr:unnamed protein product [Echinostoma caproni]
MFVRQRFDEESKKAAIEMINEIKLAFKENFDSVTWMKEEDKVKAIEKVDNMGASIGYPQYIFDVVEEDKVYERVSLDEKTFFENGLRLTEATMREVYRQLIVKDRYQWDLSPHVVNAFYKETVNHIYFPAGILQSPVYNRDHPNALNFGGIGMVMGHEITHAFDYYGSKRDANGNLRQWWSEQTREAFEKNSQCMIDQYSNYTILDTKLNGKLTLGENIADNGGMKAAFKLIHSERNFNYSDTRFGQPASLLDDPCPFYALDKKQYIRKIRIPEGLSKMDFCVDCVVIWCVTELPQAVLNAVLFDVHTVDPYRVIGTLSNSEEFARVFNCPVGSPMNPGKKCAVW